MSVAASALALCRPFELVEGETYQLSPLTYQDLARFSLWLEERAKAAIFRSVDAGDGNAKALQGVLLDQVAAGRFEPGSPVFSEATKSQPGGRKLIELMLVPPEGEKKPDDWRERVSWEIFEDADAFLRATELMIEVNSSPFAMRLRRNPTPRAVPSR